MSLTNFTHDRLLVQRAGSGSDIPLIIRPADFKATMSGMGLNLNNATINVTDARNATFVYNFGTEAPMSLDDAKGLLDQIEDNIREVDEVYFASSQLLNHLTLRATEVLEHEEEYDMYSATLDEIKEQADAVRRKSQEHQETYLNKQAKGKPIKYGFAQDFSKTLEDSKTVKYRVVTFQKDVQKLELKMDMKKATDDREKATKHSELAEKKLLNEQSNVESLMGRLAYNQKSKTRSATLDHDNIDQKTVFVNSYWRAPPRKKVSAVVCRDEKAKRDVKPHKRRERRERQKVLSAAKGKPAKSIFSWI